MLFADKWNVSPFEVLEKDIDDFIMIANCMIAKNEKTPQGSKYADGKKGSKKETRIRVNDKTATGGWF